MLNIFQGGSGSDFLGSVPYSARTKVEIRIKWFPTLKGAVTIIRIFYGTEKILISECHSPQTFSPVSQDKGKISDTINVPEMKYCF